MYFFFPSSGQDTKHKTDFLKNKKRILLSGKRHLCKEVLVGACCVMQPLDEQSQKLFQAQTQALHLVRPPASVGVVAPTQALDQGAVHVWKGGATVRCACATNPDKPS